MLKRFFYPLVALGILSAIIVPADNQAQTPPRPTVSISANPSTIGLAQSTTLSWASVNATSAKIDQGIGGVPVNGSCTASPVRTTTYTITVTGPGGTATAKVTVVITKPTVTISADPVTLELRQSTTLSWTSANATSAKIDQGIGAVPVNGSRTVSPVKTTIYTITVTGPGGTVKGKVTVTVTPPKPIISNINVSGRTTDTATVTWSTDQPSNSTVQYGLTLSYGSSVANLAMTTAHSIKLTNLSPGTMYHFKVTSTNSYGLSASSADNAFQTLSPLISLTITSPSDGDTINRSDVMVKGTIIHSGGSETGVVVNGILTTTYGNEFVANHVPLVEGSNIITATATDMNGNIQMAGLTVNRVPATNRIRITASTELGIPPLEAALMIESSLALTNVGLTYTGSGQVEFLFTTPGEYKVRMITEGIYYFTAKVTDETGKLYDDRVAITVLPKSEVDSLLRARWEMMRSRLASLDIEGALVFFDDSKKQGYEETFNVLFTILPTIVQDLSDIQLIELTGNTATYDIRTIRGGIEYSFQLLFTKDSNGIWRINSF